MKTEKQIRERIEKLDKEIKKKFNPKKGQEEKALMEAFLNLGERYGLWWVLGEVRKYQGHLKKDLKIK